MQTLKQRTQRRDAAVDQGTTRQELAMSRMQAEAERDGANGVVGVQFEIANYAWGLHTVEFYAAGTAVRRTGSVKPSRRRSSYDEHVMTGLDSDEVSASSRRHCQGRRSCVGGQRVRGLQGWNTRRATQPVPVRARAHRDR